MNSFSSLRVQGELKYTSNQHPTLNAAILGLLRLVALNTNVASEFSSFWKILEFQLGDDLTNYGIFGDEDSRNVVYLVCTGKVRLLGFDATLGREVSTQLLASEQIFGADDFFIHQSLQYRAIASSAGLIAYITLNDLKPWFSEIPNLKDYLQQTTSERQTLIFLKTHTEFRSQTSLKLQKILPNFKQIKINAGSSLSDAIPPDQGRFWLVSGKIRTLSDTQPPVVGESWGYAMTLPTWIAQSDLLVYHLPGENWESAKAIASQFPNQQPVIQTGTTNHLEIEEQDEAKTFPLLVSSSNLELETPEIDFPQANPPWSIASLWRRYPFIQQHSSSDCGAACLAMVSQYWGKRFSLNTLRNLAQIDKTGASLSALAAAAETLGYDTLTVRASLSKLEWQTNPWIAHWQNIHYVVVWQIKGDRVIICDPAIGKRSLSRQEFTAGWTEYAVLLHPTERLQAIESEKISHTRYLQPLWDYRHILKKIILTSVLLPIFGLVTCLFAQLFLDMMPFQSTVTLNVFIGSFLFFGILRVAFSALRQHLLDYFANQIDLTLIGNFIRHALKLPLQFFASRQVEDIISRVQENRKIQQFLTRHAVNAIINGLCAFVYIGLMAYYNLPLTLLVSLVVLAIAILNLAANPLLNRVSREIAKESAAQNSSLLEAIAGITTVKSAAAEHEISSHWQERFMDMLKVRFQGQKLANNLQLISNLLNHLGTTAVLWCGATLVMSEQMTIGQFVAFNMAYGNVLNPVLALVGVWDEFQQVLISIERLNDVFACAPEENLQKPLSVLPPLEGEVIFENVSFGYNHSGPHILQNISFKVKPGQTIGIVGASGAGKSTLVNLLAGLYTASAGRILIDGHDIADISLQSLRSQLGVVPQECFLFSGTIWENITLFDSQFSLDQAIAAAKLAEAHTAIVALHDGYNTQVGGQGLMLSHEQRQKIAIARAFVRKIRILILDEATTSPDASQRRFQQNLARLNRTTFLIAHHLGIVRNADCILVLDRGILVEQGTHQELMAINGIYYHLFQQQVHL